MVTGLNRCLLCNSYIIGGKVDNYPLCEDCRKSLVGESSEGRCGKCSIPLISETVLCTRCRVRDFSFSSNYSLFSYKGDMKELIYQYKFMNNKALAFLFAELLYEGYLKKKHPKALIPVPSAPKNVKRRGWDHIGVISAVLAKYYNQKVLYCLKRKESKSQKEIQQY